MLTATAQSKRYLLAGYYDISNTSFALVNLDTLNVDFFNFPYSYSEEAFSNQVSEEAFNKLAIENVLKKKKVKLSEIEFISLGYINNPNSSIEQKLSTNMPDLIKKISDVFPFVVNHNSILSYNVLLSYENEAVKSDSLDGDEHDELSNLTIYPQLVPTDIATISLLDRKISQKVAGIDLGYSAGKSLVFCGGRFSYSPVQEYLDMILILDLVKKPGFYELILDRKNVVPLSALIKAYKPEIDINPLKYVEYVGTLVNSPGETECLLNSDVGTGQFFDVKKENVYIVPVNSDVKEQLEIKSRSLGSRKEKITGGKVGLIVNTKDPKSSIYDNTRLFNDCVKQFSLCLHQ